MWLQIINGAAKHDLVSFSGCRLILLRGVAFMTVLVILESSLPSFPYPANTQDQEATMTVLAVLVILAVSVMVVARLKLNPPFSTT